MKKLLAGLLITSTSAIANINSFDGFYVGASGGYTQRNQTLSINASEVKDGTLLSVNDKKTNNINALNYGLIAGYGRIIDTNGIYLGGEISLHHDTANKYENYKMKILEADGVFLGLSPNVRYNRGPVLGLAPRLGIVFADSYMAFIKPGLEISRDSAQIQSGNDPRETISRKTKFTFAPGIGITKAIHKNLLLTVSYDYCLGNKISDNSKDGDSATGNISVKYTSHALKIGAAYRF